MENELKHLLTVDFLRVLKEDDDVSVVEVLVMHEGLNRNRCDIPHDVIVEALPSLANKPIWGIPSETYYNSDFLEHAREKGQEREIYIFGVFPESGVKNATFIEKDGKTYLRVEAILFKKYSPVAMDILTSREGNCKISVEIKARGTEINKGTENEILMVSKMVFSSATCLGEGIREGIEGSSMNVMRFSLDNMNEAIEESNDKYMSFAEDKDFAKEKKYKIPKGVKKSAQRGLDLREEYGRGGTDVGYNTARYLVDNEYATYEKVKHISKYFPRHAGDNLDEKDPPSNGWTAWCLWGSYEGQTWSTNIVETEEKRREKEKEVKNKAEDEVGKGEEIKLDTKKDSLSFDDWGSVAKPEFKRDCLKASNYKSICKTAFLLLEEGWEDGKEGALKYPVMQKKGNKLVYNRYAMASAKAYAEQHDEAEITSKLKTLYDKFDLPWDKEDTDKEVNNVEEKKIKFSLNSTQIFEIFRNAIGNIKYMAGEYERSKYWVECYDSEYVYLCDCEENKTYKIPYIISNGQATLGFENKVCVISGGYLEVGEKERMNNMKNMEDLKMRYADIMKMMADMKMEYADMMKMGMMDEDMEMGYDKLMGMLSNMEMAYKEMENAENMDEAKMAEMGKNMDEMKNAYDGSMAKMKDMKNAKEMEDMKNMDEAKKKMMEQEKKMAEMEKEKEDMMIKNAEMVKEMAEMKKKMAEHDRKEEEMKMSEKLKKFSHVLEKDAVKELEGKIKELSFSEFNDNIHEKMEEFVLKVKDVEVKNSFETSNSPFGIDNEVHSFGGDGSNKNKPIIKLG